MRHAAILDVLRAIKDVSGRHPEITTWWYAPARRLRLSGERGRGNGEALEIQIVIEPPRDGTVDCDRVAAEIESHLPGDLVVVRPHQGAAEQQRLFRLASREVTSEFHSLRASS
jgi:hypothetical protein